MGFNCLDLKNNPFPDLQPPGQSHQHHDTQHQARAVWNSTFTGSQSTETLIYVCYLRSSISAGDLEAVSIINSSQKPTK